MESVVSGIVDYTISKIDKYIVTPLASEVTYVCFINSNFEKLKSEVEMLKEARERVQNMVSNARRNADDIKPVVEKWLSEVDDIIRKYEEMVLVDEGRHGRSCSNLVQRHKLSKQARKMVDEVIQLREKGSFDQVSSPGLLINQSSQPKIVDFLDFESRVLTMNQIMDALEENHVNRIGVYGMGGVGKTMLVKEILRKIREKKSFDEVVISSISQTPDLKIIQGQLADMLGLKFEQETIQGRALKLRKRLMNEKRILVVIDDLWEYIDLETIGIPSGEDHIGCKILFTSREKHLLSNEMCTNKTFEIKVLEKHEPWNLFEAIIGEIVENRKPIAHQIVKECAHLPIAITTVAKALRNKHFPIWEDALDQLKKPVAVNIKGMDKNVYSSLKLSYDYLEGEEVKLLFLLCSMFPEDSSISIEDLQVYAISMGFLLGVDTIAQGRKRITKLVDDLISSSLLLQDRDNYVKMHDLLRDVAILISSKHDRIRTLSYVKNRSEKWEEEKLSGNYTAVYVSIHDLHNTLIQKILIPKVQFLTLRTSYFVKYELVESFFEDMKDLKSLELIYAKIPILSSSLHSCANVRLLNLLFCELGNIDMIGELKKLQILSFRGSNIIQIPTTISQLTELKVLDLSSCYQLEVIPPNILSRLTKLEELYLDSFKGWEREEWYKGRKNASLSELRYLPHLYALSLRIQNEKIIPKQLFSREINLKKFNISIGSIRRIYYIYGSSKFLRLKIESACCLDDWINTLLKRSEELYFEGSISTKTLQLKLDENDSPHLKHLQLCDNLEIKHLIHEETKPLRKILSNLECIKLENVKNLESIVHGYDRESAFHKLREIAVERCNELKNLFFNCTLDDILNLETICISGCKKMEVLFVIEQEESTNPIEFTHLKHLRLQSGSLPQLQKFCSKIEKPETSTISNGGSFFSEQVSLPNLEELIIHGADNLMMIWPNILIPNSLSKLKEVEISSCQSLEKVFPSNIMSILTCLNSLSIEDCDLLQGIFEVEDLNITKSSVVVIRNLRYLKLFNLPNLEYVWSKDAYHLQIFEYIRDLSIEKCPKLKKAYPVKVHKQLESLIIDLGGLEEDLEKAKTTQMQDGSRWFSNLKLLKLSGSLDYKLTQLPIEIVQILHNLTYFEVRSTFIEEIFPTEGLINAEEYQNATSMALKKLCLSEMPKLTHIWKESSHNNIVSLQSLSFLSISRCSQLNTLLPSSLSFKSLSDLIVDDCHRLTHLLDPSVARGLVQLKDLSLSRCKEMITVIAGGDEEENYEIVFNNLRNLRLSQFSKLTNFYSGKCIIRFPCLDKVFVEDCPEMKVFSQGIVATPALPTKKIQFFSSSSRPRLLKVNSEEFFVKDINTIFRKLWEDNHDVASIQRLFAEENLEETQYDLYPSDDEEEEQ